MTWQRVAERTERMYDVARHAPLATPPPVRIVVVAYHRADLLDRCLAGVGGRDVTVVDNSSDPDVRAVVERHGATYLDPGRNGGFGAGINHALATFDEPCDVLLLNPDAVVSAEAVERLQTRLRAEPDVASVAAAQVDEDGRQARVWWPFPSPLHTWLTAIGLDPLNRDGFGIGSVLLLRAEALAQVGGFDEDFFLYAEETDWQYRAHLLGWTNRLARDVTAVHSSGATSADPIRQQVHFNAGFERYLRKHHGAAGWQVARAAVVAGESARWLMQPSRRVERGRRMRAFVDGPLRAEARVRASRPPADGTMAASTGPSRGQSC